MLKSFLSLLKIKRTSKISKPKDQSILEILSEPEVSEVEEVAEVKEVRRNDDIVTILETEVEKHKVESEFVVLEHLSGKYKGRRFWTINTDNNTHSENGELWYKEVLFTNSSEDAISRCAFNLR
jgi:hypothetical protein